MAAPLTGGSRALEQRLLQAAADGDVCLFKSIAHTLDGGKGRLREAVEAVTHDGAGVLHVAASHGRVDMCMYLVEEVQVDIRAVDDAGRTPLAYAMYNNTLGVVQYLLDHSADSDKSDEEDDIFNLAAEGSAYIDSDGSLITQTLTDFSWVDIIPRPSFMVLPRVGCKGTCIGHAYAECLTSRRRIIAKEMEEPVAQAGAISIPWLINELAKVNLITDFGGKSRPISEHLLKHGAPLEGTAERAYIKDYKLVEMVDLQKYSVYDLREDEFLKEFERALSRRKDLMLELATHGPVVGLFKAGSRWPHANGEVYYDQCETEMMLRSRSNSDILYGWHAVLVYSFDNTAQNPFSIGLDAQDSWGPFAHTDGRARMDINALKAYIAPEVVYDGRRKANLAMSAWDQDDLVTTMFTNQGENEKIKYAVSSMQGWGEIMEDAHAALPDLDGSTGTSFFGVYDGHGGPAIALYSAKYLHVEILNHEEYYTNVVTAVKDSFLRVDDSIESSDEWTENRSKNGLAIEGCTACVTLIRGNQLIIGNVGDSRAVLSRNGQAIDLTKSHRVDLKSGGQEVERVVIYDPEGCPHVLKNLEFTRAIGFGAYKQCTSLPSGLAVTCNPDISTEEITHEAEFLVIASDGIWDTMSSQAVVDYIQSFLRSEESNLGAICERLLSFCAPGGDNMTVVLVQFKNALAVDTNAGPLDESAQPGSPLS